MLPMHKARYSARAVAGDLGETKAGQPQVAINFEITEGEQRGERAPWYGHFTDKTTESTILALRVCGWRGDDLADLSGISDNEVEIVVEPEKDLEGNDRIKVRWVNAPGGVALAKKLDEPKKASFAAMMRGQIVAATAKLNAEGKIPAASKAAPAKSGGASAGADDDIPF